MSQHSVLRRFAIAPSQLSPLSLLMHQLSPESQVAVRKLISILKAPIDAPSTDNVISSVVMAVTAYEKTLAVPTREFSRIAEMVISLADACAANNELFSGVSDDPLRRRLMKRPAWGLLLEIAKLPPTEELLVAVGVEIAYCLAVGKPFPDAYATSLRRSLNPSSRFLQTTGDEVTSEPAWRPHFRKVFREAKQIFEGGGTPPDLNDASTFATAAINELRGKSLLPKMRHRQAILDHAHQSPAMLVASAHELRSAAAQGSDDALLTMLAFLSGLSLRTTHRIPLAGSTDDWVMELDIEAGTLKTDIERVFTKGAHPRASEAHRPAARVISKPLPWFLAQLLLERLDVHPEARCVADLLPAATCDGNRLTYTAERFGIEPSAARFVRSAAGFTIAQGIDRLLAAALANDFGVIPASKLYYCRLEREEVWTAAGNLYGILGWEHPTDIQPGTAFGSRVTPTHEALRNWHHWMRSELARCRPAKNCRTERLIEFHNRFAEACAAISVFCLASRAMARIRYAADELGSDSDCILLFDKRTGHLPRKLPVPVNTVVSAQVAMWGTHCRALERRLTRIGLDPESPLRRRLRDIEQGASVDLFFQIDATLRPLPLSSHRLVTGWPKEYGFDPDFGRHFWEAELRLAGINGHAIDLFMRHQIVGIEGHCSTSHEALNASFSAIALAQESTLASLGIGPCPGLAKK